jgi:hypothetical protein
MAGITSYTQTIDVTGATGSTGSITVQSSVAAANLILLQGFSVSAPADVVGITDLFVTTASPNWNITLGVGFAAGIDAARYTIYYYGS